MIEFPKHKIILELGEDNSSDGVSCLERVEIKFDSQIDIEELMNRVFRPILISLGYSNKTINDWFNMNEFGEEVEETKKQMYDTDDI